MQNSIQNLTFNGNLVSFSSNAYLNATVIANSFGKRINNYLRNERTTAYIQALEQYNPSVTLKSATKENQLVIVKQGGKNQGTWLHPKLAIDFARWLSPEFAVWCDIQISEILGLNNKITQNTITTEQQYQIKEAVNQLHHSSNESYQSIYTRLYNEFKVPRYQELLAKDFEQAMKFLGTNDPSLKKQELIITANELYEISVAAHIIQRMANFFKQIEPAFHLLESRLEGKAWSYGHEYGHRANHLLEIVDRLSNKTQ